MRYLLCFVAATSVMAALLFGGSYLLEQRQGAPTLLNAPTLFMRNVSAISRDAENDKNLTAYRNTSSPNIAEDSSHWSIGKVFVTSLHSKVNHGLARVLRAVGMSLAIGIAAGICTCLLGPMLCYACLCCMGFRSRGVATSSVASYLQKFIGNAESGSCFSGYQSLGARGLTSIEPIVVASFVVGASSAILSLIILSMD